MKSDEKKTTKRVPKWQYNWHHNKDCVIENGVNDVKDKILNKVLLLYILAFTHKHIKKRSIRYNWMRHTTYNGQEWGCM